MAHRICNACDKTVLHGLKSGHDFCREHFLMLPEEDKDTARDKRYSVCSCGCPSVPGLYTPMCQYHYDSAMYGPEWARKCSVG